MKRNAMGWVMLLTAGLLALLSGCGSPDNSSDALDSRFLSGAFYVVDNVPPEFGSHSIRMFFSPTYSSTIAASDIDTIELSNDLSGMVWKVVASTLDSTAFGTGVVTLPLVSSDLHTFPLGGSWPVQMRLKNGKTSLISSSLREPGTLTAATHRYLYTADDWTPTANQSDYVALLGRFPTNGVTFTYSTDSNGTGTITSSGFAAADATYLAAQPAAYNLYCTLYDASGVLLGESLLQYKKTDHSSTGLVGTDGEIKFTAAQTSNSSLDLSTVKLISIVTVDGAQFQATNPGSYQMRAYSSIFQVQ